MKACILLRQVVMWRGEGAGVIDACSLRKGCNGRGKTCQQSAKMLCTQRGEIGCFAAGGKEGWHDRCSPGRAAGLLPHDGGNL